MARPLILINTAKPLQRYQKSRLSLPRDFGRDDEMKIFAAMIAAFALLALTGCAEEKAETYPFSGQPCGEADPVLDIETGDCAPIAGI